VRWTPQGKIAATELYEVDSNPAEHGRNLATEDPNKAEALKKQLLGYLESVDAEKPKPRNLKRRKGRRKNNAK